MRSGEPELHAGGQQVLHPDFAILAEVGGKPAAFVLTVQNVNPIMEKLDGKLFPFGIFRLLYGKDL